MRRNVQPVAYAADCTGLPSRLQSSRTDPTPRTLTVILVMRLTLLISVDSGVEGIYTLLFMAKHSQAMLEMARRGAVHRIQELRAEIVEITKVFPHLRFGAAISPSMPDAM